MEEVERQETTLSAHKSSHNTTWKKNCFRSQLQAINKLASGVQELARFNAKHLKVGNEDQQQLLEFRGEEAEKTRKDEKETAELHWKWWWCNSQTTLGWISTKCATSTSFTVNLYVTPSVTCIKILMFRSTFSIPYCLMMILIVWY